MERGKEGSVFEFAKLPGFTQLPRLYCRLLVSFRFNDSAGSCRRGIQIYFEPIMSKGEQRSRD